MRVDFLCKERFSLLGDTNIVPVYGCFSIYCFLLFIVSCLSRYSPSNRSKLCSLLFALCTLLFPLCSLLFALAPCSLAPCYSREMRLRCLSRRCDSSSRAFKSSLSISH